MFRLKSRNNAGIGGFWFTQPELSQEEMQDWDFNSLVQRVVAARQRNSRFNLSTDHVTVANEVDEYNAKRMSRLRGGDQFIQETGGGGGEPPKWVAPRKNSPGVVGGGRQILAGVAVLLDWLGSGGEPVIHEIAERRAGVCAACPQNQPGNFASIFTEPVANKIKQQLEIRKQMNLATTHDEKLQVCAACLCPLKLKVHVPLEFVEKKTPPEIMAKLDPSCWILAEMKLAHEH